ncbi:MAG: hypothetical protein Tsb0014_10450 [Pleurocapsa sp.]
MTVNHQTRILFWGIQRSGNHALINWILEQYQEPKLFLNNQPLGTELKASAKHLLKTYGSEHFFAPRLSYIHQQDSNWLELWLNPTSGINQVLLVSFENKIFDESFLEKYNQQCQIIDDFFGTTQKTINIVLLRDAFNMWIRDLPYPRKPQNPQLWKAYAKEYLGETNFLPNKIAINYNQWFMDVNYRQNISQKLGIAFSDAGIDQVPQYGGGSTFDGTEYNGKGQGMNVLNRWEESTKYRYKRRLFHTLRSDGEMRRLIQTIYPDLEQKWNKPTWKNFIYYYF